MIYGIRFGAAQITLGERIGLTAAPCRGELLPKPELALNTLAV